LITESLALLGHAELGRLAAEAEREANRLDESGNHPAALAARSIGLTAEKVLVRKIENRA
jgi:hypothetical protein